MNKINSFFLIYSISLYGKYVIDLKMIVYDTVAKASQLTLSCIVIASFFNSSWSRFIFTWSVNKPAETGTCRILWNQGFQWYFLNEP